MFALDLRLDRFCGNGDRSMVVRQDCVRHGGDQLRLLYRNAGDGVAHRNGVINGVHSSDGGVFDRLVQLRGKPLYILRHGVEIVLCSQRIVLPVFFDVLRLRERGLHIV